MSERECTCDRPITRLRKKRKYCHECGGKLTLDSGDTPQQQRSSNILDVFEPREVSANPANENIYEVPRDAGEESAEENTDFDDTISGVSDQISINEEILANHEREIAFRMNQGGLRNLRLKPPTFSGKQGENIKQFFSRLEKYLEVQQIQDNEKVEAAGLCFEGFALEHYDALIRTNRNIEYEELKQSMTSRFSDEKISIVVRSKINKRTLKANETVQAYYNELKISADQIEMSDEAFLFAFIQGLPADMRKQIVIQKPETSEEALDIAKTLEQMDSLDKNGLESMREAKIAAAQAQDSLEAMREMMTEIRESIRDLQANSNHGPQTEGNEVNIQQDYTQSENNNINYAQNQQYYNNNNNNNTWYNGNNNHNQSYSQDDYNGAQG